MHNPSVEKSTRPPRLPAFLAKAPISTDRPKLPISVGRLKMPIRASEPNKDQPTRGLHPVSPHSPLLPKLKVTTLVVPRMATMSPIELSESNLLALNSRERRAHDMLSTLRRRTASSEHGITGNGIEETEERRLKWKRHSAPADLSFLRPRTGFEHPVLAYPGGF